MPEIFDMPDDHFRSGGPVPMPVQAATRSPYTGTPQVSSETWHGYFTLAVEHVTIVGEINARPWRAFFAKLNGQEHWFKYPATQGAQYGVPVAAAVYLDGQNLPRTSLLAKGFPVGDAAFPTPGMFVTIQNQLLLLTAVAGDAGGPDQRHLTFWPPLRDYAEHDTPIEVVNPYGVFMLDDSRSPFPAPTAGQIYSFSFEATDVGRLLEE